MPGLVRDRLREVIRRGMNAKRLHIVVLNEDGEKLGEGRIDAPEDHSYVEVDTRNTLLPKGKRVSDPALEIKLSKPR